MPRESRHVMRSEGLVSLRRTWCSPFLGVICFHSSRRHTLAADPWTRDRRSMEFRAARARAGRRSSSPGRTARCADDRRAVRHARDASAGCRTLNDIALQPDPAAPRHARGPLHVRARGRALVRRRRRQRQRHLPPARRRAPARERADGAPRRRRRLRPRLGRGHGRAALLRARVPRRAATRRRRAPAPVAHRTRASRYDTDEARLVLVQRRRAARDPDPRAGAPARPLHGRAERGGGGAPALCTHDELMHAVWADEPMHSRESSSRSSSGSCARSSSRSAPST